jgi:hypothetical protein
LNATLSRCLIVGCWFAVNLAGQAEEPFDYHSIRRQPNDDVRDGKYEAEAHFAEHGRARVQGMQNYGPDWSGDAHLLWDGSFGDEARLTFRLTRTSRYRLSMQFTRAPDYGIFQVFLDGQPIGKGVDLYANRVKHEPRIEFEPQQIQQGQHTLTLRLISANTEAKKFRDGYLLGLDFFKIEDETPPPPPPLEVKQADDEVKPALDWASTQGLLRTYCLRCHQGDDAQGDMELAASAKADVLLADLEKVEAIADAIRFGAMPPEKEAQPSKQERRRLAEFFEKNLEFHASEPGSVPPVVMRRLNRYEYNNAVRDLLELRGDIYPLPERTLRPYSDYYRPEKGQLPSLVSVGNRALGKNQVERQILDGVSPFSIDLQAEHGFNNRGEELSISPVLFETFVRLGESIVNSPQFADYCQAYERWFGEPKTAVGELAAQNERQRIKIARDRIGNILERAFRRPVEPETLDRYVAFFATEYRRSRDFTGSMKRVVAALLASPRFLYLNEKENAVGQTTSLDNFELATRLSFFLWSTLPDEELVTLATNGQLSDPVVLEAQVRRMLEDRKSRALSESFARQWLRLDQLITAVPDFDRFPQYYSRIGCEQWKFGLQTMVEPLLLFEAVVVEDRSIMLFIDSNFTYRSDELQSWYREATPFAGRENVNRFNTGSQVFRRRELNSRREGGVITTAATMTMTSSPLRTSPITRGAWVATVILNQPPPPPPDIVPEIEADDAEIEAQGLTLRQRLKQHQADESCASCHAKIDPLGFVLENYDAVGRWRDKYRSGLEIDAGGTLLGDEEFDDIESFKDVLLRNPDVFMRAFTEHLLSYAVARELRPEDRPVVDRITRRVRADHGRFSTVVVEIVKSQPFRSKTNQSESHP